MSAGNVKQCAKFENVAKLLNLGLNCNKSWLTRAKTRLSSTVEQRGYAWLPQ